MKIERFPVEAAHVLMFARAIADPNPAYTLDSGGEMVVPPTFAAAGAQFDEENRLRPRPGETWFGSGREPTGAPGRTSSGGLHAEQHYDFHAPLRPGVTLSARRESGRSWERTTKDGRSLHFQESITEYRDADTDQLYVTARQVGVIVEKAPGKRT
ncbi:FAS1-like dehydratase domain-containing protein [Rhodococcus wratislaviensis]|uniref:FAS1-like dehydratase domain-containing protein n=1 Tax=Rhodococcus wratislaviensis TaxID=44752 RepID=UPI0036655CF0